MFNQFNPRQVCVANIVFVDDKMMYDVNAVKLTDLSHMHNSKASKIYVVLILPDRSQFEITMSLFHVVQPILGKIHFGEITMADVLDFSRLLVAYAGSNDDAGTPSRQGDGAFSSLRLQAHSICFHCYEMEVITIDTTAYGQGPLCDSVDAMLAREGRPQQHQPPQRQEKTSWAPS